VKILLLLWSCVVYKKEFGENGRLARTGEAVVTDGRRQHEGRPVSASIAPRCHTGLCFLSSGGTSLKYPRVILTSLSTSAPVRLKLAWWWSVMPLG